MTWATDVFHRVVIAILRFFCFSENWLRENAVLYKNIPYVRARLPIRTPHQLAVDWNSYFRSVAISYYNIVTPIQGWVGIPYIYHIDYIIIINPAKLHYYCGVRRLNIDFFFAHLMKYIKLLPGNNKMNTIYTFPAGVRNTIKYRICDYIYICLSVINVILYCVYFVTAGVQKTL